MIDGEKINTTQQAGTRPENTKAWSNWALRHLSSMRVLRGAGILGPENKDWRNVAEHLLVVNATAMLITQKLVSVGEEVDTETVDEASILHDVTKRIDRENGVSFANEHTFSQRESFLSKFGHSPDVIAVTGFTGRVPEMFIEDADLQRNTVAGLPLEQLVVGYADARVRNTSLVSLEEARDLNKVKVPADEAVYDQWYLFYKTVEDRLMGVINDQDFTPQSINDDSVIAFVKSVVEAA